MLPPPGIYGLDMSKTGELNLVNGNFNHLNGNFNEMEGN